MDSQQNQVNKSDEKQSFNWTNALVKLVGWVVNYVIKKMAKKRGDDEIKLNRWKQAHTQRRNNRIGSLNASVDELLRKEKLAAADRTKTGTGV